jgi:hypothetical protein
MVDGLIQDKEGSPSNQQQAAGGLLIERAQHRAQRIIAAEEEEAGSGVSVLLNGPALNALRA